MPEITEERLAQLEQAEATLKTERTRNALTRALETAKCRPDGVGDALAIMTSSSDIAFGADGTISKLTIGGKAFDSADAAAKHFVGARKYLSADTTADKSGHDETKMRSSAGENADSRPGTLDSYLKSGHNVGDLIAEGWRKPPE